MLTLWPSAVLTSAVLARLPSQGSSQDFLALPHLPLRQREPVQWLAGQCQVPQKLWSSQKLAMVDWARALFGLGVQESWGLFPGEY